MKKFFNKRIVLGMVLVFTFHLSPFTSVRAQMQAVFAYSTFYAQTADMPYVETYLSFDAWTMQFVQMDNGSYRATAEVLTVLKQSDSVCYVKKYDLNSPTVASLDELNFNFLDVQRFSVKNGIYDLEITLRDKGSDRPASTVTEKLVVNYDKAHPAMSSLQLMSSATPTQKENILSRGGYDMEPYVSDFYPEQVAQLHYYFEVYNIDQELGQKPFIVMAFIEQQETGIRVDGLQTVVRKNSSSLVPVYGSLDIAQLSSGNYNLVVELRNKDNQLMLYKKVPFFRSNPGRRPGLEEKQAFLYRFWQVRYPMSAEAEWLKYKERVDYVQATFSYPLTQGIHTDRGRVYLQYGPPDFVRDEKNFVSVSKLGTTFKGSTETMQTRGTISNDELPATDEEPVEYSFPFSGYTGNVRLGYYIEGSGSDMTWLELTKVGLLIDTSAIQGISGAGTNDAVYSLQGVKLNKAQRGVNIINGKKVLVK